MNGWMRYDYFLVVRFLDTRLVVRFLDARLLVLTERLTLRLVFVLMERLRTAILRYAHALTLAGLRSKCARLSASLACAKSYTGKVRGFEPQKSRLGSFIRM